MWLENLLTFIPQDWRGVTSHLIMVLLIVVAGLVGYVLVRRALRTVVKKGALPAPVQVVLLLFVRWAVIVIIVVLAFEDLGVLHGVWAVLSAILAMVAIGFFAVWSTLSNFMCTLLMLVFKPFKIGDWVELVGDGVQGKVVDLTFMFTTLREEDGSVIRVPNALFFQKSIRCRSLGGEVELDEQLLADRPADEDFDETSDHSTNKAIDDGSKNPTNEAADE